jgi:hypothetical protein
MFGKNLLDIAEQAKAELRSRIIFVRIRLRENFATAQVPTLLHI